MDILIKEHQELLLALLKHKVAFLLIGGYAVIYYGYDRVTGDMDIWLQPDNKNLRPLLLALQEFGIEGEDIEKLSRVNLTAPQMFFVGEKPRRIDFLTQVSNIKFEEAANAVNYFSIEGHQVPVIQYDHRPRKG